MDMFRGRWLALALWLAVGSARAQSDDILPERQGPLTRYPSIEAALDAPAGETVMVVAGLSDFIVARPPNEAYERRLANVVATVRHARARNVPIHMLVNMGQRIVPAALAAELANYPHAKWIGYDSYRETYLPWGQLLTQDFDATGAHQTWFESIIDMSKTRNVVLATTSIGASWPTSIAPLFEAVWHRLNVYTNANLTVSHHDYFPAAPLFFRRLDQATHFLPGTVPRALPGLLIEDPYLHWVPIGGIANVAPAPPRLDGMYSGGFSNSGLPLEHRYAPGDPPYRVGEATVPLSPYESRAAISVGFSAGEEERSEEHTSELQSLTAIT